MLVGGITDDVALMREELNSLGDDLGKMKMRVEKQNCRTTSSK